MNSYKLNGQAGHHFRLTLCKGLGINTIDLYKTIKNIDQNGIIETKNGKKYEIILVPIEKN